ncbi:MAG: hypothetical protein HYX33_01705 [Actinobacteria bacterium]|nr:hypothetical protein [Actinomycetota bacterium]
MPLLPETAVRPRASTPLVAAAAAIAALIVGSPRAAAVRADRPTINSFYVADEGRLIHFRVTFCEQAPTAKPTDRYGLTFRLFTSTQRQVLERRVVGRINGRCGTGFLKVRDRYVAGRYLANVAVTNITRQAFSRIPARPFTVR